MGPVSRVWPSRDSFISRTRSYEISWGGPNRGWVSRSGAEAAMETRPSTDMVRAHKAELPLCFPRHGPAAEGLLARRIVLLPPAATYQRGDMLSAARASAQRVRAQKEALYR